MIRINSIKYSITPKKITTKVQWEMTSSLIGRPEGMVFNSNSEDYILMTGHVQSASLETV